MHTTRQRGPRRRLRFAPFAWRCSWAMYIDGVTLPFESLHSVIGHSAAFMAMDSIPCRLLRGRAVMMIFPAVVSCGSRWGREIVDRGVTALQI